MKLRKTTDCIFIIDESGNEIAKAEKQYIGTHGHWKGYLHYIKDHEKWIWCGIDPMFYPIPEGVPAHFANAKQIKEYYNVA